MPSPTHVQEGVQVFLHSSLYRRAGALHILPENKELTVLRDEEFHRLLQWPEQHLNISYRRNGVMR